MVEPSWIMAIFVKKTFVGLILWLRESDSKKAVIKTNYCLHCQRFDINFLTLQIIVIKKELFIEPTDF